jgi:chromosome segregation ATPase
MQSKKLVNQVLLGSVSFGVSFGLGLLVNRDLNKALLAGVITVPATYTGAVIVDKQRINQEKLFRGSFQNQIQELEKQQTQLNQALFTATTTREELEASINTLKAEHSQLSSQLSEQYYQRDGLNQDLATLHSQKQLIQQEKQKIEGEFCNLKTQVQALEKQQETLNQSLATKTVEIERTETNLNCLRSEIERLKTKFIEQENDNQALTQEFSTLKEQKRQLETQRKQVEAQLDYVNTQFNKLQNQLTQKQNNKRQLDQELATLQAQKQQSEVDLEKRKTQIKTLEAEHNQWNQLIFLLKEEAQKTEANLKSLQAQATAIQNPNKVLEPSNPDEIRANEEPAPDSLPSNWTEFMWQLSEYEIQIIKAIVEEDNPIATIKRIAEEQLKMPIPLIDSINERAKDTLGDFIIEPGSNPPIIADEEYLVTVQQMLKIYEYLSE